MNSWIGAAAKGLGVVSAVWLLAGPAAAQENLDAGKSGAQLFKSNCAICHKSAQALNKSGGGLFGLDSFLREHYTSSRETAAAIAAYLNSVGGPAEAQPPKKRVRTEKKKDAKPDAKPSDAKPSDAKPPEAKPSDTKPEQKKPEEKSGEKPADKKPEKKEGGKAALVTGAPQRG